MSEPSFQSFSAHLAHLPEAERADVKKAYDFAVQSHSGQKREDDSPYVSHVIEVAAVLAKWEADRDTIIAALLHDVIEDTKVQKRDILEKFGRRVALLVDGITKFTQADLSPTLPLNRKVETLRKLFDVMRVDMRCVLIKLADRYHNVQSISVLPGSRPRRIAEETLSVYYKIASHLGMRELRHVFAEECVPYAFDSGPEDKAERDRLYEESKALLPQFESALENERARVIAMEIEPRNLLQFHLRREEKDGKALLLDATLLSVVVKSEEDCYHMLKVFHTVFRPVTGTFRDFIAAPSEAGYQSLHTVVMLPEGGTMEVRIRTSEMARQAAKGVILWLYGNTQNIPPTFSWLRRSKELDLKTRDSSGAFWEALEADILRETVSIVVDRVRLSIPRGSTVLDAAYALYDSRAGFLKSATVAGRQEGLATMLKEDDALHLTFDEKEQVGSDWLQMVSTTHARLLIVDVLKKMDRSEKVALGRRLLQKELDHYGKGFVSDLTRGQHQYVAAEFRRAGFDDVLAMVGEGVIRARDMLFALFPEKGSADHKTGRYSFRLHLNAMARSGEDILSLLNAVIRTTNVTIERTMVKSGGTKGVVDIMLIGSAADRIEYADFVELLDRQEWISQFRTLISRYQKALLLGSFFFAFLLIGLDILFLPYYRGLIAHHALVPEFVIQTLPLIPILVVNYYLLQLLRHYVVRMRSESWFLGVGLFLNIVGLGLLVVRLILLSATFSIYPLIAIFTIFLLYLGYKFFQTDSLFSDVDKHRLRPIADSQWSTMRHDKVVGYVIRFLAVIIWGVDVIYIKYTPVNLVSPFLRTFLLSLGVLGLSAVILALKALSKGVRDVFRPLKTERFFLLLVFGQVGYMYLQNASLLYTTGTNLLLFHNFGPLLGLLIAAAFWRREIAYLKEPATMFWIFILAMTAGIGGSILVYNTVQTAGSHSIVGDGLALLATLFDVLLVVGQIEYVKKFRNVDPALLNTYIFSCVLFFSAPVVIGAYFLQIADFFRGLSPLTILLGMGIGLFIGTGQMLNYVAFKRIDGYLAYIMFNLSFVIAFTIETFVIRSVHPTTLLLISAALIIGSTAMAELINSRAQKKGL